MFPSMLIDQGPTKLTATSSKGTEVSSLSVNSPCPHPASS
jgi:hypothetical protein